MNDIIIIGGGIAGLYTFYQLQRKYKSKNIKIKLFEKENYFGGRILTLKKHINNHDYQFEGGAGRLNNKHILFLKLIYQLKLKKELIKISGKSEFIPTHGKYKSFKYKKASTYIDKVIKQGLKENQETLIQYTFTEYAHTLLTSKEVDFILNSYGYYGELFYENAYDAIKIFNEGIRSDIDYYILKNGFSSVIEHLLENIIHNKGKLYLNSELKSIHRTKNGYELKINNSIFKTKKIILALPKPALLNIDYLRSYTKELNSIQCKELCRIYSIFSNVWFNKIKKTTTNNKLRFIIPIDKENGLIMSSYTDSKYARFWKKYIKKSKDELSIELVKQLKEVFNVPIEYPIYNIICYWNCGVGFWKKKINSDHMSKKILQLNTHEDIFIVGENYSKTQGWVEGALETVETLIKIMKI